MKLRTLVIPALALVVSGAATAPVGAQGVTLRYNWAQGDVLTYRMVVRTTRSVPPPPQGGKEGGQVEQTMSQTLKVAVSAVTADGTAILRQTVEAVSMDIHGPMGDLRYDSAHPPGEDADPRVQSMAKTFGGMVGEALSVTMAANGAIRRIDGSQRIIDKLMKDLPRDPMAGGLAQNIRQMFSEDALRSSLEQSFSRLPDTPVKPGDTWTSEQTIGADAVGKITGTSTFTLKAVEGAGDAAVARIAVALALKQQEVPPAGASVSMRLGNAKGDGELLFQVGKGRVERNTMRTDMPSTVTVRAPDGGPMNIQNNTKTTMTMELVK